MKTFYLSILVMACIVSCKKKDTNTCEITMEEIAGSYQLTKFETVSFNTGEAQDITSTLSSCELLGIYNFKIDSTATYIELNNCNGSGSGLWGFSEAHPFISFDSGNGVRLNVTLITSWDCSHLVLMTYFPTVAYNYRYTLTKR